MTFFCLVPALMPSFFLQLTSTFVENYPAHIFLPALGTHQSDTSFTVLSGYVVPLVSHTLPTRLKLTQLLRDGDNDHAIDALRRLSKVRIRVVIAKGSNVLFH
jgi:hypothetical protein